MMDILLTLILIQEFAAAATRQSNRELELRLIQIQESLQKSDAARDMAVVQVNGNIDEMQRGIEVAFTPHLQRIAAELASTNDNLERLLDKPVYAYGSNQLELMKEIGQMLEGWLITVGVIIVGIAKGLPHARGLLRRERGE